MTDRWWEKYIGLPFVDNVFDCGQLYIDVQKNEFGREVFLPVERKEYTLKEIQALIEDRLGPQFDVVDVPETGDMVLMKIRGRETHVGTYVDVGGVPYVLHTVERIGTLFSKKSHLVKLNCTITKFYRPRVDVNRGKPDQGPSFDRVSNFSPCPAPALTVA